MQKKISLFLILLLVGFGAYWASRGSFMKQAQEVSHAELPSFGTIQEFVLRDERNEEFSSKKLAHQVWIASFMFTRCQGPCPLMSQKMARLQKDLAGVAGLHQISITMDPSYDTPEVLKAYGESYAADPARWTFLTGERSEIIRLAIETFRLPAGEEPDMHSTRFVLIDGSGVIRGYYDSTAPDALAKLTEHAKRLAAQASV